MEGTGGALSADDGTVSNQDAASGSFEDSTWSSNKDEMSDAGFALVRSVWLVRLLDRRFRVAGDSHTVRMRKITGFACCMMLGQMATTVWLFFILASGTFTAAIMPVIYSAGSLALSGYYWNSRGAHHDLLVHIHLIFIALLPALMHVQHAGFEWSGHQIHFVFMSPAFASVVYQGQGKVVGRYMGLSTFMVLLCTTLTEYGFVPADSWLFGAARPISHVASTISYQFSLIAPPLGLAVVLYYYSKTMEMLETSRGIALQNAKDALVRAEDEKRANMAKTRFVSVMSHEIRNPLQAVLLQLDMLSYSKLNTAQRGYVDGMQRACGALLSIVNDILDVTKIDSGAVALESTPIVLRQLVEETVEAHVPTAVAAGIELVVTVEPTLDTRVVGDPTRIRQVLQNFLSNALKFTAEGEVEVLLTRGPEESEGEEGEKEQGSSRSVREVAGALWTMSVRDTGIGIDEAGQEKLFHEFSQVDESTTRLYGGTGLGLFICKELSSLMGGSVAVESERGVGSTFSASFRAPPAPSPEDLAVVRLGPSRVQWTVLVHAVNASLRRCVERYARFFLSDAASVDVQHSEFVRGAERLVAQLADATSRTNRLMVIVHYSDATTDLLQALSTRTPASCSVVMLAAPPSANTSHLPTISPRDEGWRHVVRLPVTLDRLCTAMDAAVSDHVASSPSRRYIAATRSTGSGSSSTTSTPSLHSSTRLRKVSVSSTGSPSSSAARRNAATVLIVDDFALIRDLVQELVRQLGYRTLVAANGEEAIALVTEHYESIGLVLMDCEMPICDGFQATDAIRALEADRGVDKEGQLFVCAMTGNASREDELQCAARGLSGFLAKPVSRADLETCLAQHVQLPTQRQRRPAKKKKKGAKGRKKQLT